MTHHVHALDGCSTAPLAHYLKALGVLRLVVEQRADPRARGWWEGERFFLLTELSREELEEFFLARYEPTPMLSPWNKGCGFFKENDPGLTALEGSRADRFGAFRRGITESRALLDAESEADKVIRAIKARTKTNRTFQSEEQRKSLMDSAVYRECLGQLRELAAGPDLPQCDRDSLAAEIETVESLTSPAASPPTRQGADGLKENPGYKRLLALAERRFKALKSNLIPRCRRAWRGPLSDWFAAAVVLNEAGSPRWPSLLGTGGNDGNLDFTNNFMQRLGGLFDLQSEHGEPTPGSANLLAGSLWGVPADGLSVSSVGQYQPGAAGGANRTTGPGGDPLVNPWDFVLMMEGALVLSSSATRSLDPGSSGHASAPFAVRSHASGFASPGSENARRGEQWMPLWSRPATFAEVASLFRESRVQLGRRPAHRPVAVVRAINRLGVARGVVAFTRYGYLERNGQSTLAVPLGRVRVHQHPRTHLIDDLATWLDLLQRRSLDRHAPSRLVHAERRLSNAVIAALTHDDSPERWQAVLLAASAVESLQAAGTALEAGPIPPLRPEWAAATGGSPEVRLALALGSAAARYSREGRPRDPVRHHWLPLTPGARRFQVSEKRPARDPRVVMTGRELTSDAAAVVQRRLIEAGVRGQRRLPLVAAPGCAARLGDLADLLAGSLDLARLLGLVRAFMAIRWEHWAPDHAPPPGPPGGQPEEVWLALRVACLPWPLANGQDVPAEPTVMRRLLAGDTAGAVAVALARLRSAGIRPPLRAGSTDARTARLWAAALAFPIDHRTAWRAVTILDPSMGASRG